MTRLAASEAVAALRDALHIARERMRFRARAQSARVQELWPLYVASVEATPHRWALRVWNRLYSRASDACLERSLQLVALLRRQGREAEIVIGFRRDPDGRLSGHAWVEGADVPSDAVGHMPVLRLKAPPEGNGAELFVSGI